MKTTKMLVAALLWCPSMAPAQDYHLRRSEFLPADHLGLWPLAAGDLDGDGDLDLVVARGDAGLRLLENDGEGRCTPRLALPTSYSGPYFACVAVADVDGDGDADLVLGRSGYPTEPTDVLLRNDGNWVFTDVSAAQMPATTDATNAMWAVDIDQDGDLDVACANSSGDLSCFNPFNCFRAATLLRNDGSGRFTSVVVTSPAQHTSVVGGDFDGDGDQDLAFGYRPTPVANLGAFRLLLNQNGALVETTGHTVGALGGVRELQVADADGDGDLDLFGLVSSPSNRMQLFLNQGNATFVAATNLPAPTAPQDPVAAFAVGDLDRDGDPDVLVQERDWLSVELESPRHWRNQGGAAFVDVAGSPDARGFVAALLADLDGDQDLDGYFDGEALSDVLAWNDGNGVLSALDWGTAQGAKVEAVARMDVDVDGARDLLVAVAGQSNRVLWLRGDGYGNFAPPRVLLPFRGIARTRQLLPADFDNDGDEDLYVVNFTQSGRGHELLRNDGGGAFTDVTATALPPGVDPGYLARIVDFDGNGLADVWRADNYLNPPANPQDHLFLNQGNLVFVDATATHLPAGTHTTSGMVAFDFDGDGDQDGAIATSPANSPLQLLVNDGAGVLSYATGIVPPLFGAGVDVAAGDFDGDGDPDLVLGLYVSSARAVFLRNDAGRFVDDTAARLPPATGVDRLQAVDTDFDGDLDLLVEYAIGPTPRLGRYRNAGAGVFQWEGAFGGSGTALSETLAADLDRDGDLDLAMGEGLFYGARRDLHNALPPRVGMHGELRITANGGNGIDLQLAAIALGTGLAQPAQSLGAFGELLLDPAAAYLQSIHLLPGSGGAATVRYPVPGWPGFLGLELFAQGFFLHTPDPASWRTGNLARLRVAR